MTVIAAVLIAALVASNYLWLRELRKLYKDRTEREERLLNRIQHPEVIPTVGQEDAPSPEHFMTREKDDYDFVGTIQSGDGSGD